MINIPAVVVAFLLLLCTSAPSFATTPACGATSKAAPINSPSILFANGILNDFQSACDGLRQLKEVLRPSAVINSNTNFYLFHNSTGGLIEDLNELRIQAAIESAAKISDQSRTEIGYTYQLGSLYNNLLIRGGEDCKNHVKYNPNSDYYLKAFAENAIAIDDDWILICNRIYGVASRLADKIEAILTYSSAPLIVVAHSQGNFYFAAARSLLISRNVDISRLKYVGVAAITSHPPGRYLNIQQDTALYRLQRANVSMLLNSAYNLPVSTGIACAVTAENCNSSAGGGANDVVIAGITGSEDYSYRLPSRILNGILGEGASRYLLHEFAEVYLSTNIKLSGVAWSMASSVVFAITEQLPETLPPPPTDYSVFLEMTPSGVAAAGGETTAADTFRYESSEQSGRNRPAMSFNNGAIRVPNSPAIRFDGAGLTYDAWVRLDSLTGMDGYGNILNNGAYAAAIFAQSHDRTGVAFMTTSTGATWAATYDSTWSQGGCNDYRNSIPVVPLGQWFRATYTASPTLGVYGYVNGRLAWSCPNARPNFSIMNTQNLYIGRFSAFWYPIPGAISDAKVWRRALSATEIRVMQ